MSLTHDLKIDRLTLEGFRSYTSYDLEPGAGLTIVVGPNASGKSNLLEAVQLTTAGASFRHPKWQDLVRDGAPRGRVRMEASGEEGSRLDVELTVEGSRRRYLVNGKPLRRRSEIAGRLPAVVFTPEGLSLVKGAAESRRDAIDEAGESLSSAYGALRRDYARVLRQRNALLKESGAGEAELEPWTEQIAILGGKLAAHRAALVSRMGREAEEVYREIAGGEQLRVGYADSYGIGEDEWGRGPRADEIEGAIRARLKQRRADEIRRKATLVGPHRDDITFRIGGRDARTHGSQGQQRTAALAWKIAELRVVREMTGHRPVLLLDDVMSELDEKRRSALTKHVQEGLQTMITTTTLDYFPEELLRGATVVRTGATPDSR